jgi:cation transport ATPase
MPYQVVHAIAGRLRIRVPRLAADQEFSLRLNRFVAALTFVTEVRINSAAHSLVVSYAASGISVTTAQTELLACIQRAESAVLELLTDFSDDSSEFAPVEPESEPQLNHWQDLTVPAISLGVALLAAPLEIPALLAGGAIAAAAMPWVMRATDSLVTHRHPNIDLLDSLWMGLQTLQGQYVAPALKTTLVEVRRSLRGEVVQQQQVSYQEGTVWVERKGENCCLPVLSVQVGDRVIVNPGDRIPVDGQILEGSALLDISDLTELATPIVCSSGDRVYASGQVLEGRLSILAERTGENTRIALIANLIKAAPIHDTEIGHRQSEFVKSAIFPTIGLSGAIFALTGSLGAAISLYQLDFGSGIQISILTTLFSALTYAVRQGIFIRSARILELLAQVDTIVFDASSLLMPTQQGYELRPESVSSLAALQAQNIQIYWVIDSEQAQSSVLESVAVQLGIHPQQVFVNQHQQAELVHGLQQQGKTVAFVSATNCPVDRPADVTVSLASDVAIAEAIADVHLLDHDLQGLVRAIAIGKRAMEVVYQNTAIIVIPNLLVQIGGGIFLGLNPVVNVITNNSSAFVAEFLHSARPLFEPDQQAPQSTFHLSALKQADALRQNALAKRLAITSQALTHKRSKPDFADWSQHRDPDGQAWIYESKSRWFYAISTQARNLTRPVETDGRVPVQSTAHPYPV